MTIRAKTLLMVTCLLAAAVLATAGVLGWSSRRALLSETEAQGLVIARLLARSAAFGTHVMRDVEAAIGEQMIVEATIAAHLVAVAEAAGFKPQEINRRLKAIAKETVLDEFWITDTKGHAYLRSNTEVDFTFSADPVEHPQAHAFWPLLAGESRAVVQEARKREVDTQVYKYAGVAGVDKPRIVQVGYNAAFLEQLEGRMGLSRLMHYLVAGGNVIAIRVLDHNMLTVDYSELAGRSKIADVTAADLANFRRLVHENRTAAFLRDSVLTVMAPIGDEGGELNGGAILVSLPTDHVQSAIGAQARLAVFVSGLVLLLGSVIALVAAKTITNPIHQFTQLTRRISGGDLTQTIEIHGQSELGVLAASFNEMSRRLTESMEHLKQTTAAKERIESELKIASEIQMSMLPKTFPPFPDHAELDIHAAILPAKEVGGDFYDFFFIDEHRLCLVIADVSGKGIPAALFMAVTKTLLRAETDEIQAPDEVLSRLNRELCRDNDSCMFVTVFCGILDTRTGRFDYSNGGHNLPYRLSNGGAATFENTGGAALGLSENTSYRSQSTVLNPGEGLFLYTDGVTEAMDAAGGLFSERRLEEFLMARRGSTAREIVASLLESVKRHSSGVPQSDDVTTLVLRYGAGLETSFEIRLKNKLPELQRLHRDIAAFGSRHRLRPNAVKDIQLALEEIVTNTISYGYDDNGEHEIVVRLSLGAGEVNIEVEDDGRAFNPLEASGANVELPLNQRPVGGLGIHLARRLVDSLEYERRGRMNLLIMKKRVEETQA
ncbi:MAG TPA: SpoIIE family protein phosphatase [Candidatus Binatia bacterium]|nr:SpoIIE family protein phosphatase [Candidatus Binatia bacterium]